MKRPQVGGNTNKLISSVYYRKPRFYLDRNMCVVLPHILARGALGGGRRPAAGGLESGADRRLVSVTGRSDGGKEWIYQHIRADRQTGGTLYRCLRRRGKKPNWRGGRHAGRGHIPDRVDIAERPAVVEEKCRIGGWELDTILGARHRGALVSAVDRGSKFRFLEWVEGKTASAVTQEYAKVRLAGLPA